MKPEKKDSFEKKSPYKKHSPIKLFSLFMASSLCVYILFYLFRGDAGFADVFFRRGADLFMDFFNSVRDASQGAEVYTQRHVIYPPMANLIYLVFSRFLPNAYNESGWYERYTWTWYRSSILFIALLTAIIAIILFVIIHEFTDGSKKQKLIFAFFAVVNVPVLYMIERGNIIVFCLMALMIYAFTYNSENRAYREIGLIALAFAFSLKLYPVVFGWFLIIDKRYKDAARCALYGLLMLIIPSFFFGGPVCFVQIFKNILSFSTGSAAGSVAIISRYSHIPFGILNALAYIWCGICAVCFVISSFIHKQERWKTWMIGLLCIMTVPSLTSLYVWAFLLIPLVLLSNSGKVTKKDWSFVWVIYSLFAFTILRFNGALTINAFLIYPFVAALSIMSVIDIISGGVKQLKAKKAD